MLRIGEMGGSWRYWEGGERGERCGPVGWGKGVGHERLLDSPRSFTHNEVRTRLRKAHHKTSSDAQDERRQKFVRAALASKKWGV